MPFIKFKQPTVTFPLFVTFIIIFVLSILQSNVYAQDSVKTQTTPTYTYKKFLFLKWKKKVKVIDSTDRKLDKLLAEYDSLTLLKKQLAERTRQKALQDSLKALVLADTVLTPFYQPESIRFGVDGGFWLKGIASKDPVSYYTQNKSYDGSIEMSFRGNKWFLVGEFGYSMASPLLPSTTKATQALQLTTAKGFQNDVSGGYILLGVEYNFMRKYFNDEALVAGVRYGRSFFNHSLAYSLIEDSLWNVQVPDNEIVQGSMEQTGLSADWFELVGGLKVNVWKNIFVGTTVRIFLLNGIYGEEQPLNTSFTTTIYDFIPPLDPPITKPLPNYKQSGVILRANEIPGFGNTESPARLSFSVTVSYRINLKKRPSVVIEQY
ncbi:MAG: DUF6048 family protein [Thermoflexibacteraceae bacterium]